jgi:hypothetical protein
MLKQRTVSETLGHNNTHHHEEIYKEIERKIGPTLICNFGNTRGSKTGVKHEGSNPIPIRDFELHGVSISPENNIIDLSNSEYLALSLLALSGNVNLYQFQEVLNSKSKDLSREQLENLMSRIRKKIRPHIHGSTEIIKSSWGESSYRLCFDINLSR